jgi:hypothetical protein
MVREDNKNINHPILLPMKKPDLTPLLLAATLFLATGAAATAGEAAEGPTPEGPDPARREAFVNKFDRDGDGRLSREERAEARASLRRPDGPDKAGPRDPDFRRGFMLGRFDQNNDGRLDETERAAARAAGEKRMRVGMEKQLARLKSVDADGDGKISDTEWAAAREKMPERRGKGGFRGPHGPMDEDEEGPPDAGA